MAAILITGANQGIGYHLTAALLRQGHQVAVLDWETHHLAALQNTFPTQLAYYPVDVRQGEALQAAVAAAQAWQGTPEVVIHNACCCPFGGVEDLDLGQVQAAFATNYYGALQLVRCVGPALRAQGRGRVIFTSSGVGITGFPGLSAYASTKGALEALAKCLNLEYAGDGVTFHLIHPPLTRTQSSAPLPVPPEMMADPETVGQGLARRLFSPRFLLCHSLLQKVQTLFCYAFPLPMGSLLAKLTARYQGLTPKNRNAPQPHRGANQPSYITTGILSLQPDTNRDPRQRDGVGTPSQAFWGNAPKPWRRADSLRPSMSNRPQVTKKEGHPNGCPSFLERVTRLELATSTLARWRSTR